MPPYVCMGLQGGGCTFPPHKVPPHNPSPTYLLFLSAPVKGDMDF